jgi:hypothetical protein
VSIDFSNYVPPSVLVQDNTQPLLTVTGVEPSVVCLVGPALGYKTATQNVVISPSNQALTNHGVLSGGSNAPVVKDANGNTLTVNTDYVLTTDNTGSDGAVVSIKLPTTPGAVASGDTVTVAYRYKPVGYSNPVLHTEFDSVVDLYGNPLVSTSVFTGSQIVSPLSLAAQEAFTNGATRLITIATDAADGTLAEQLVTAYAKVDTDYRVGIVVPILDASVTTVSAIEGIAADLRNHCVAAAADGLPRIGILGTPKDFDGGDSGFTAIANAVHQKRVILAYPSSLNFYSGYSNTTIEVDGYYLAAAFAGRLSAIPVQKPLTKEVIVGFAGIPARIQATQTKANKNAVASQGVCMVEVDRNGNLVVRHGLTTDYAGGLTNREISVVRARDTLFTAIQYGLDQSGLIGSPIDFETPQRVKAAVSGILENAVQRGVVLGYVDLKARQLSSDPSVIEVKFAYRPALPLNYIVVSFSINVDTGSVDLAQAA